MAVLSIKSGQLETKKRRALAKAVADMALALAQSIFCFLFYARSKDVFLCSAGFIFITKTSEWSDSKICTFQNRQSSERLKVDAFVQFYRLTFTIHTFDKELSCR